MSLVAGTRLGPYEIQSAIGAERPRLRSRKNRARASARSRHSPGVDHMRPGDRLGPYEVLAKLGEGGMGEVYKARDTRLDRTVAIKVLPAEISGDPDRRARFEREARAIAALNHPHICTLHDVSTHEGTTFLVMEHLAGETLSDRLQKRRLPLDQTLTIAIDIADALAAAHRRGVVHRDLKPGNVMLTKTGAKLLDFGLAKLTGHGEQPAVSEVASAPTRSVPLTHEGTIVGTLPYMAPEQIEGKPADARTNLWAFGAIVYEMVTGRRAFEGPSSASLIANIINTEPPALAALQPLAPPALDRLVRECLSKSPDDRPDTAHDLASELRGARESSGVGFAPLVQPARARWRRVAESGILILAGALAGTAALWLLRPPQTSPAPVHATIPLKTWPVETVGQYAHIAISPDGHILLFKQDGLLVRRPLNSFSTAPLEGTQNAQFPAFKPDGSAVAFSADRHIKRVAVFGGPVADVATVSGVGNGMTWGEDDRIYFSAGLGNAGIWRVSATGGTPEAVTRVDDRASESAHAYPQLLPGGKALLFTVLGPSLGSVDSKVVAQMIGSQERTTLANQATFGRYLPSGHLVFTRNDGTIYAVPFDPAHLETSGTPVAVLSGVGTATAGGAAFLVVSQNGTLAFLKPTQRSESLYREVDAEGQPAAASFALGPTAMARIGSNAANLRVAPDGTRYALTGRSPGVTDVWILDARTGESERVTFDSAEDEYPVWSPDSSAVAYTSAQTGTTRRIFVKTIGTGKQPTLVRPWPRHIHVTSWSMDSRWLAAHDYTPTNGMDVWAIAVDGTEPIAVASGSADESSARFSPDGRWIAYVSNESGREEVYVVSFPDLASTRQVSTDGAREPVWDLQGRVLYYLQQGYLVSHEVQLGTGFSKGHARRLFATPATAFDVAPEGRFVLAEPNPQPPDGPLYLIVNWFEELKAKVPAGGAK